MTLVRSTLLVAVSIVSAGCASNPRDRLLRALSSDLAEVRSAPRDAPLWKEPPRDLAALTGTPIAELKRTLGQPDCVADGPMAPCPEAAAVSYDFFYLPPGWRGGGATLLVHADPSGRCDSATWMLSK
jgi:hypothetical protein